MTQFGQPSHRGGQRFVRPGEPAKSVRRYAEPPPERVYEILGHVNLRRVLLLEDDCRLAGVLQASLEISGFQITHVTNGVEGLKLVLDNDYDLLLCDMAMPGFPGDMFYRGVERVRPHLCQRFLFMTGHTGDRNIIEFVRSIRGLLIWKPFDLQHLMETANLVMTKADAAANEGKTPWAPASGANIGSGSRRGEMAATDRVAIAAQ